MGLTALSEVLWRERHLLELLLFKLEEEQLVLTSGRTRWLTHATREVETVLEDIRQTELARAVHADTVAEQLGINAGASLSQIAAAAPAPWNELLIQHRDAFIKLTAEISQVGDGNRELLAMAHRATQETLMSLDVAAATYDGTGHTQSAPAGPSLIDQTL